MNTTINKLQELEICNRFYIEGKPAVKMRKPFTFSRVTTIPTRDAINIYTTRSQLPSAADGRVMGFEKLLQGLNSLNDEFVMIHSGASKQGKCMVFTDTVDKVLGTLTFKN